MIRTRPFLCAHVIATALAMIIPTICWASQTARLADGTEVRAEYGHVAVPERRGSPPSSREISIPYVRLLSEADQGLAPVVYLEGGPGASGIEALEEEKFAGLFKDVLAIRDLILVDQRGTGDAKPELECWRNHMFSMMPSPTPDERLEVIKRLAMDCADQMRAQGIDLAAYNSNESADDIADLAKHLAPTRSFSSVQAMAVIWHWRCFVAMKP